VPAILTVGVLTAAFAAILASGLTWPGASTPLTLAAQHEQRADEALSNDRDGSPGLERAAIENAKVLESAPMTASAWLRASYIRTQTAGALDADALRDLDMSYRVAPLGPAVSRWRLRFVFENWPSLTPTIRAAALNELRVFAAYQTGSGALVNSIQNPAGRLAAKLTIRHVYMDIAETDATTAQRADARIAEM
jgi:hypothetical protein